MKSFDQKVREQARRREAAKKSIQIEYHLLATAIKEQAVETRNDVTQHISTARTTVVDKLEEVRATVATHLERGKEALVCGLEKAESAVASRIERIQHGVSDQMERTRASLSEGYSHFKAAVDPEPKIREHPWGWAGGALAAGFFAGPALRNHFSGNGHKKTDKLPAGSPWQDSARVPGLPGASEAVGEFEPCAMEPEVSHTAGAAAMLQPVVDSMLPYVSEMGRRFMQNALDRMFPEQAGEPPAEMKAEAAASEPASASGRKFPKSISRRRAPPPH